MFTFRRSQITLESTHDRFLVALEAVVLAELVVQKQGIKPELLEFFFVVKLFEALTSHEESEDVHVFDLWASLDHVYEMTHILVNLRGV